MANILDIFSIGFDSNGLKSFDENLKKTRADLDKAEGDVKALETELENLKKIGGEDSDTFKAVSKQLEKSREDVKKFSDEISKMEGKSDFQLNKVRQNFMKITRAVATLAIVGATVKRSLDMYKEAEQIGYLAQKADVAVESLQKLANASSRFGGDTESTASTIQKIQTTETKQKIVNAGISVGGTPEQTLENIAAKMETLKTNAEKLQLADTLGLDEGTTRLLMEGVQKYREELKRTSKYRLYTKEDIERMRDYRQVQSDIDMGIKSIQGAIARLLLPSLTALAKGFRAITDWLAEHEGAVKIVGTFLAIATSVAVVTGAVSGLVKIFKLLSLEVWKIIGIAAGWIAVITLVIAVIQDFITWLNGGESALQGFWETGARVFEWLKQKVTGFISAIRGMWDALPDPIKKIIGMSNPLTGTMTMVNIAKEQIGKANNNPINTVPAGAVQNYNSNVANRSNTNTKTTNIGSITVNTQATNGAEVAKNIQQISDADDGLVA